ncbi:hypothetical protein BC832DRAFT_537318 [Gaertneriomyces semiglobifer]|nr:hypothetical protein BC832DRAFT_537318 [Gaertneriomyces semiglobifer]
MELAFPFAGAAEDGLLLGRMLEHANMLDREESRSDGINDEMECFEPSLVGQDLVDKKDSSGNHSYDNNRGKGWGWLLLMHTPWPADVVPKWTHGWNAFVGDSSPSPSGVLASPPARQPACPRGVYGTAWPNADVNTSRGLPDDTLCRAGSRVQGSEVADVIRVTPWTSRPLGGVLSLATTLVCETQLIPNLDRYHGSRSAGIQGSQPTRPSCDIWMDDMARSFHCAWPGSEGYFVLGRML